jgi:hypothetical protein
MLSDSNQYHDYRCVADIRTRYCDTSSLINNTDNTNRCRPDCAHIDVASLNVIYERHIEHYGKTCSFLLENCVSSDSRKHKHHQAITSLTAATATTGVWQESERYMYIEHCHNADCVVKIQATLLYIYQT